MSDEQQSYVQALALSVDPAWRRLDAHARAADADAFLAAHEAASGDGVTSYT